MDAETEKLVSSWNASSLNAIEISGTGWNEAGFASYLTLEYPEFDVCAPSDSWPDKIRNLAIGTADLVIAEQVWKHLRFPYRAGQNVLKMLRPGGRFLLTTPFLLRVHGIEDYSDCTRWTAEGMKYFLEECGFDPQSIETYAWGNKECAAAHVQNEIWFEYQQGMNLENDPIYPCVVWAVARKPL
jgi:SAM-dependent methyltransferase